MATTDRRARLSHRRTAARLPRRHPLVWPAALLVLVIAAPAALVHFDYGFKIVGPNACELEWASNHSSTAYSAETVESGRSSAQFGCRGVSGRVRYKSGTTWLTRYEEDTTKPYDVYLNGSHSNGYAYSDHNGKNYQNSVWYGFRNCHQGPC